MSQDQQTYQRATMAAVVGTIAQAVLSVGVALLGLYAQSKAINAAAWYVIGGLPIWISLWVLFRQHQMERAEALEAEQLAHADAQAAALFEEAGQQLALARKRLDNLYKYGMNIVGGVVGVYLLALGGVLLYGNWRLWESGALVTQAFSPQAQTPVLILLFAVAAFGAFLIARFVAGMTEHKQWIPLRAGASYLMGNALVIALLVAAAIFAYFGDHRVFAILAIVIPAFMVVLGLEVFLALMLGIYRPRRRDEFVRPAYDSRLMGWLTRPESIGKIFADTINYQFGFDIASSWFYRLLAQAALPLTVIGIALLLALSSVVIVQPQQQAIFTTFGQLQDRVAKPGLAVNWPWPIGGAQRFDVYRVHQIDLGSSVGQEMPGAAVLWTNEHTQGDEQYLVTAPTQVNRDQNDPQLTAGGLIGADIYVKYTIADVKRYAQTSADPEQTLTAIAGQQINRYFATRQIDQLLSAQRLQTGVDLLGAIQSAVDQSNLGLKVVFVSLAGVHPPQSSDVAATFHQQIEADQEKQTTIEKAKAAAIGRLAEVAGTREKALAISNRITELANLRNDAAAQGNQESDDMRQQVTLIEADIESMMDNAGGEAAQQILDARAYRWTRAIGELARTERFRSQLQAYRQAPGYYRTRLYLDTLADAVQDRRKIILNTEKQQVPTVRLELKPSSSGLDSILNTQ